MHLTIEIRRTFSDVNTFARFAAAVKMLEAEFSADAEPIGAATPVYMPRPAALPSQAVQAAARYEAAGVTEQDPFAPAGARTVSNTDADVTAPTVAAPAGGDGGDAPRKRGRPSKAEKEAMRAAETALLQEAAASTPAPVAPPLQAPPMPVPAPAPVTTPAAVLVPPALADNALAMAMGRMLQAKLNAHVPELLKHFNVTGMSQLPKDRHAEAVAYIDGLIAVHSA